MFGRTAHVHSRSFRRAGFGHRRRDGGRLHRKRLFQPGVGAQDRQAFRAEHRFLVPFRARRRPQHAGLCGQAGGSADEGTGRRQDFERHHGHLPRPDCRLRFRPVVRAGQCADRQGNPRRDRACHPRGARSEDTRRKGGCADRGRAALSGRRAARSRPYRRHSAHLRLQ